MKAAFLPFLLMTPTWTLITNPQRTSVATALSDANRSRAEMDAQTSMLPGAEKFTHAHTHTHTHKMMELLTQLHFNRSSAFAGAF